MHCSMRGEAFLQNKQGTRMTVLLSSCNLDSKYLLFFSVAKTLAISGELFALQISRAEEGMNSSLLLSSRMSLNHI